MFEELPPEEKWNCKPCTDPQHNPPNMIVITKPMRWRCPSCGFTVTCYPSTTISYYSNPGHTPKGPLCTINIKENGCPE